MALGATVLTIVLAASGYLSTVAGAVAGAGAGAQQPDSAVAGIVLSFSIVPAAIIGLSLATFSRYPLRKGDIDAAASGVAA
jgi:Na+/melibiose symporter-like transporter